MSAGLSSLAEALADHYRVIEEVGRGGMATVYRAHDLKHDRPVALKVLHGNLAATLGPERFKREILTAARLQHPHILSVFDSGEAAGRLWFTMPFVEGESLRDRLQREGTLSVEDALTVTREAAQALAYANRQGVIHRDIKPENILLTEDGSTLVADFGIACAVGDPSFTKGLTQTGATIGTPTYMAPEQATGESALDERADQYALAAVLYEMLSGQPPFTGATAAALIAARFSSAVTPVRARRADVPTEVEVALQRALALKAVDRFPTITDFARALAPALRTPSPFETMAGMRGRPAAKRSRGWVVTGLVLVAGAAAAGFGLRGARGGSADGPVRIAVLPLQNVGDTTDAYFADGMTDELRTKLVSLPGLQVIARASSMRYAGTTKDPSEIAEALGVRYLLAGTLRYERGTDGRNVVHVRPELMEVGGDGPATTRWQASFDEPVSNATQLPATIAAQVAGQLQVALGTQARTALATPNTANEAAYDAYLRGVGGRDDTSPAVTLRRIADLQRAVALDPGFAQGWSELSVAWSWLFHHRNGSLEYETKAWAAAQRVRTLAAESAADHVAHANYFLFVKQDMPQAEAALRAVLARTPNDADALTGLSRILGESGRSDEGRRVLQQGLALDPLNAGLWHALGVQWLKARRADEATQALRRALVLAPPSPERLQDLVIAAVATGDMTRVRAVVREAYRQQDPATFDTYVVIYLEMGWVLESEGQQRVLDAPLALFDGDVGNQQLARAQVLRLRGDTAGSRRAALAAVEALRRMAADSPDDPQPPLLAAFGAALGGRVTDAEALMRASREIERRVPTAPSNAVYYRELRARVAVLSGRLDDALTEIEAILAQPAYFSRGHLALDPMWAPLRALPRYRQLMTTTNPRVT